MPRTPPAGKPPLHMALAALFVLLTLYNCVKVYRNAASGVTSDLRTYYVAAEDLRNGRTPYQHRDWLNDYIYPPFFAWTFGPLTLLPVKWAAVAWSLCNAALWLGVAGLSLRLAPLPSALAVLPSLFAFRFIWNNWGHGQVNLLLLLLIVAALREVAAGREWRAGALLGAGVAVKVIPALFVVFHAMRGQWKLVAVAGLATGLCILAPALTAGPSAAVGYLNDWADMFGKHSTDITLYTEAKNQSLFACMMRFLAPIDASARPELRGWRVNVLDLEPRAVARLFLAVSVMLLGALAWRLRGAPDPVLAYTLLALSLPLFSKTALEHHWVVLLFAYTVLLNESLRRRWVALPIALAVVLTNAPGLVWRELANRMQAFSPSTAGLLILWAATFALIGQRRSGVTTSAWPEASQ